MVAGVSLAVAFATAGAFLFLTRDLQHEGLAVSSLSNARLAQAIFAEIAETEETHVADFEQLEGLLEGLLEEQLRPTEATAQSSVRMDESEVTVEDVVAGGVPPRPADITIEATHNLQNAGQHRPYTLSLHFSPRPRLEDEQPIPWTACVLRVEWPLPRGVFVDVWSLRRLAPFTIATHPSVLEAAGAVTPSTINAMLPVWSARPRHPDLEAPAYGDCARPFVLTAEVSFAEAGASPMVRDGRLLDADAPWNLDIRIPDLVVRYQQPVAGRLWDRVVSKPVYIPAPQLHFQCMRPDDSAVSSLRVAFHTHRLRPLVVSLPVGAATLLVGAMTMLSVAISSLLVLVVLLRS